MDRGLYGCFPLLLPALLAFTTAAMAGTGKKEAPAGSEGKSGFQAPAVKFLEYTHETVGYPGNWKTGPKTKDLLRTEFSYQQGKTARTCAGGAPWTYVTIGTEIAPCWKPDAEFFAFVKKLYIDGFEASLYRRKKNVPGDGADPSLDDIPGQSYMTLTFTAAKRCYVMKFQTCEKWVKRFFPDFQTIMNSFRVNN